MSSSESDVGVPTPTPDLRKYTYPFAASPDIIRANQKDAYFQNVLFEHIADTLRILYGSRVLNSWTNEARTLADLLYLGLTTFIGNQTLGEEYTDILQVEDHSGKLPEVRLRSGYILTSILVPYGLNKILPRLRRNLRVKLERAIARADAQPRKQATTTRKVQQYILDNLDTITSPAPVYAVSLAAFYFTGAYYHISKRLWGLRYIFTRIRPETGPGADQRVGYEVLGVLLVLQLSVQSYLHIRQTMAASAQLDSAGSSKSAADSGPGAGSNSSLLFSTGSSDPVAVQQKMAALTRTPPIPPDAVARVDLANKENMRWLDGRQVRKCTLCLESMKDPSVTTCGHMFCWTCISDWCREKPECPLCRQSCLAQHILPLRG